MGRDPASHASPRQYHRSGTARHRRVFKIRKVKVLRSERRIDTRFAPLCVRSEQLRWIRGLYHGRVAVAGVAVTDG